jgi:hypothetical protein
MPRTIQWRATHTKKTKRHIPKCNKIEANQNTKTENRCPINFYCDNNAKSSQSLSLWATFQSFLSKISHPKIKRLSAWGAILPLKGSQALFTPIGGWFTFSNYPSDLIGLRAYLVGNTVVLKFLSEFLSIFSTQIISTKCLRRMVRSKFESTRLVEKGDSRTTLKPFASVLNLRFCNLWLCWLLLTEYFVSFRLNRFNQVSEIFSWKSDNWCVQLFEAIYSMILARLWLKAINWTV